MPGENFQKQLNKQGQAYIEGLRAAVHQLWVKCCEADGIPPESKFVVFSDNNQYMPFYNQALCELREAEAQYAAGGYVGLKIERRR